MIVTRYMTGDKTQRIVAHVFESKHDVADPDDWNGVGRATISTREAPGDTWGAPSVVAELVPLDDWRRVMDHEGFTFEERS